MKQYTAVYPMHDEEIHTHFFAPSKEAAARFAEKMGACLLEAKCPVGDCVLPAGHESPMHKGERGDIFCVLAPKEHPSDTELVDKLCKALGGGRTTLLGDVNRLLRCRNTLQRVRDILAKYPTTVGGLLCQEIAAELEKT